MSCNVRRWLLILTVTCLPSLLQASESGFVIIGHPDIGESEVQLANLRHVFTAREQFWQDGKEIRVIMRDLKSPAHLQFCNQFLRMFPYQVQRIWHQVTYSGQGSAALSANSDIDVLNLVYTTPGSVGYVSADTPIDERVKVIEIVREDL